MKNARCLLTAGVQLPFRFRMSPLEESELGSLLAGSGGEALRACRVSLRHL